MVNYSKQFASFAKQDNKLSEKFSKNYPKFIEWKDEQFNNSYGELLSIVGHF